MAAAVVAGGFLMAGEWEARVKILLLFRQVIVIIKNAAFGKIRSVALFLNCKILFVWFCHGH